MTHLHSFITGEKLTPKLTLAQLSWSTPIRVIKRSNAVRLLAYRTCALLRLLAYSYLLHSFLRPSRRVTEALNCELSKSAVRF